MRDALRPAFYYSGMIRPSSSAVPIRNGSRFPRRKPYIGHRTRKNADPSLRFGPHRVSGDSLAASAASSDIPATSARRRSGIFDNLGTHFRTGDSTLPSALYPNKRTYRLAQPFPDSSESEPCPIQAAYSGGSDVSTAGATSSPPRKSRGRRHGRPTAS